MTVTADKEHPLTSMVAAAENTDMIRSQRFTSAPIHDDSHYHCIRNQTNESITRKLSATGEEVAHIVWARFQVHRNIVGFAPAHHQ